MGIHTALDTDGSLGDRLSDTELENIDLVLLDVKSWDTEERHFKLTGTDIGPVVNFARRLATCKKPTWLRFVLVPGLTDDAEDISRIATFAASLGNVKRVDVLFFQQMGRFKWKELKLNYALDEVQPQTPQAVVTACQMSRAKGLHAY